MIAEEPERLKAAGDKSDHKLHSPADQEHGAMDHPFQRGSWTPWPSLWVVSRIAGRQRSWRHSYCCIVRTLSWRCSSGRGRLRGTFCIHTACSTSVAKGSFEVLADMLMIPGT